MNVYLLTYTHKYGTDTAIHKTELSAWIEAALTILNNLNEVPEEDQPDIQEEIQKFRDTHKIEHLQEAVNLFNQTNEGNYGSGEGDGEEITVTLKDLYELKPKALETKEE